jgi:hypothetical protein
MIKMCALVISTGGPQNGLKWRNLSKKQIFRLRFAEFILSEAERARDDSESTFIKLNWYYSGDLKTNCQDAATIFSEGAVVGFILCLILLQLVFDAVNECLPGSFDDVFGDADRAPHRVFVPRFDYYPNTRGGACPGIDHANLIID